MSGIYWSLAWQPKIKILVFTQNHYQSLASVFGNAYFSVNSDITQPVNDRWQ